MDIFVAGHRGMVGSAIVRYLESEKPEYSVLSQDRKQLDLRDQAAVRSFFKKIGLTKYT